MKKTVKNIFSIVVLLSLMIGFSSNMPSLANAKKSSQIETPEKIIENISGQSVTKLESEKLPYYSISNTLDVYTSGGFRYRIDSVSGQFVEVMPIDPGQVFTLVGEKLSLDALTKQANEYFEMIGFDANLDELTLEIGDKEATNYFFRWNSGVPGTEQYGKTFIQIGFTLDGQFLNLVNTLPFAVH